MKNVFEQGNYANKVAVFIEKKAKFNGAFYIKNVQWVKKVGKAQ